MERRPNTREAKLRNTIGFVLKEEYGNQDFIYRDVFEDVVLETALGVRWEDTYCLQNFPGKKLFDLSLISDVRCKEVWAAVNALRNEEPLKDFYIEPLFARELRTLTVHMFNPYVAEEDILNFLKRFVDVQDEGVKQIDKRKYWTGNRRYRVRFRFSEQAADGLVHPPATFAIGSNRGYLFYPGQPLTCRRCGQEGHMALNCEAQICRQCDGIGHISSMCTEEIKCNLCGKQGHVYRECPKKAGSYSAAISKSLKVGKTKSADREGERSGVEDGGRVAASVVNPPSEQEAAEEGVSGVNDVQVQNDEMETV
ncbi:ZCHC3 protein, partial [Atractosteus spatula]|nr:ZCHC3 protein [Atractosteus spatula]